MIMVHSLMDKKGSSLVAHGHIKNTFFKNGIHENICRTDIDLVSRPRDALECLLFERKISDILDEEKTKESHIQNCECFSNFLKRKIRNS